jgi:predicted kinase
VATLTITRGLPGSGKTTWAKRQPGHVRVNRDELRRMLHGEALYTDRAERHVTLVQRAAIEALLRAGVDVICDDTNLRHRTVRDLTALARACGADVTIKDFTAVPLEVCVARDAARLPPTHVGERVIRTMHHRYLAGHADGPRSG